MSEYQSGFSGHPPVLAVDIIEEEVRRTGRRLQPPPLQYLDDSRRISDVSLALGSANSAASAMRPAQIIDVGIGGVALSSTCKLEVGAIAVLFARRECPQGDLLFGERFRVCNCRRPGSETAQGARQFVYGMSSQAENGSLLYKMILDSIFVAHFRATFDESATEVPWQEVVGHLQQQINELPVVDTGLSAQPEPAPAKPRVKLAVGEFCR